MKRLLAIILYLAYGLVLTLGISFGSDIADVLVGYVDAITHRAYISDITVDIDLSEPLMINKNYYANYTVVGEYHTDAGLKFESLDPDKMYVAAATGVFYGKATDGELTEARLRVTSKYDSDFEKVFTVKFKKVYPESFEANYFVKSVGWNTGVAYVGIPITVYSSVSEGEEYSEKEYEIVYDSEYFTYDSLKNEIVPIKQTPNGEKLTLGVRYKNGNSVSTNEIEVRPMPDAVSDFDEIRIDRYGGDNINVDVKEGIFITLIKDGNQVITDYSISTTNIEHAFISNTSQLYFDAAGEYQITVTLSNGFSRTHTVFVKNDLRLPEIFNISFNANGAVEMLSTETKTLLYAFADDASFMDLTVIYDDEMIDLKKNDHSIVITPKAIGNTAITLALDDGYERKEAVYNIEIVRDTDIISIIGKNARNFVAKFMGHLGLFAVLAFFALNMFRFVNVKNKAVRFSLYTLAGLIFAVITEFIQYFMPYRESTVRDVFIDMGGYYVGTLAALLIAFIISAVHRIKKR